MMQTNVVTKETANLLYVRHANGIHEFNIKNAHRSAVDELMVIFDELYATTPRDQLLLRLFDMQAGLPPVAYIMQQTRRLLARHHKPPKSRNAMIYKDNLVLSLLRPSVRFLPFSSSMPLAFFRPDERERAIAWLLKSG